MPLTPIQKGKIIRGGRSVPFAEYMYNTPIALAKGVQDYLGEKPVAYGPGQSLRHPLLRTILYTSKPGFLGEYILPRVPESYIAQFPDLKQEIQDRRCMEAQKWVWRNVHSEWNGYSTMTLPVFRTAWFVRAFNPPGNVYRCEYYNAAQPRPSS